MGNEWFKGMTLIEAKKERMAKMVSEINKTELVEIVTIPETKEEIKKLNHFYGVIYTREQAKEQVYAGLNYIIRKINEMNQDLNRYLTRKAEEMTAENMWAITAALDKFNSYTLIPSIKDSFPFLNTSDKAGDFLVYIWEFFANARGIIGNIYDNRRIKVTDYKKTGFNARHNWEVFTGARKLTEETTEKINEILTKRHEEFKKEMGIN